MEEIIKNLMDKDFMWFPKYQIGYSPATNCKMYDDDYFNTYVEREKTEIGKKLNEFRINLVNEYIKGKVLDIGIGSGFFIRERRNCLGYDICPRAIDYLKSKNLWYDPYEIDQIDHNIKGVTFFDSLEHINKPGLLLNRLNNQHVFISMPIFKNLDHILKSRHFKPKEHCYYFTMQSLLNYMKTYSYEIIKIQDDETRIGRENIVTFTFRRAE